MKTKVLLFVLASAFLAMLVMGCEGTVGPTGPKGEPGGAAGGGASNPFFGDWLGGSDGAKKLTISANWLTTTEADNLSIATAGTYLIRSTTANTMILDETGLELEFDAALLAKGILRLTKSDNVDVVESGTDAATIKTAVGYNTFAKVNKIDANVNTAVTYTWTNAGVVAGAAVKSIKIEASKITVGAGAGAAVSHGLVAPLVKNGDVLTGVITTEASPFVAKVITINLTDSDLIGVNAVLSYQIDAVAAVTGTYFPQIISAIPTVATANYTSATGVAIKTTAATGIAVTSTWGNIKVGTKTYFIRGTAGATDTGETMVITAASPVGLTTGVYFSISGDSGYIALDTKISEAMTATLGVLKGKSYTNASAGTPGTIVTVGTTGGSGVEGMLATGTTFVRVEFAADGKTIKILGKNAAIDTAGMADATVLTLASPVTVNDGKLEVCTTMTNGTVHIGLTITPNVLTASVANITGMEMFKTAATDLSKYVSTGSMELVVTTN